MKSKRPLNKLFFPLILFIFAAFMFYNDTQFRRNPYSYNSELKLDNKAITIKIVDHEWRPRLATFAFILNHPLKAGFFVTYYDLSVILNVQNKTKNRIAVDECYLVDEYGWYYQPTQAMDFPGTKGSFQIAKGEDETLTRLYENVDIEALPAVVVCGGVKSMNSISTPPK